MGILDCIIVLGFEAYLIKIQTDAYLILLILISMRLSVTVFES